MIYAIDIDGTICEDQDSWWEYSKAKPIPEAIQKVNKLFHEGHQVVLFTARYPENREVTLDWLNKYGVLFHEIIFGKFRADVYIDNCAKRMEEL